MLLSMSWVGCGTSSAGKRGDGAALFGQGTPLFQAKSLSREAGVIGLGNFVRI